MKNKLLTILVIILTLLICGCQKKPDYLVLVNKDNPIDSSYIKDIKLVTIKDYTGQDIQVEEKTAEAFTNLKEALLNKGIEIGADSAYRSYDEQVRIMNDFIQKYGEDYAKNTVAIPGTSEHHTGLVVDIVIKVNGEWIVENEDMIKNTEVFKTIHETINDYGFIVRYLKGKESVTGYDYEPWHLRYVEKENAKKIAASGLSLEEYLIK